METAVFKDILFDLINESDKLSIVNIAWNEDDNLFVVQLSDLSQFAVQVKPAEELTEKERAGLVGLSESISNFAQRNADPRLNEAADAHRKGNPIIKLVPPKTEA